MEKKTIVIDFERNTEFVVKDIIILDEEEWLVEEIVALDRIYSDDWIEANKGKYFSFPRKQRSFGFYHIAKLSKKE